MSEYIPFEIQVEVIKRLPVKSLLQFRSVSKQWKSLIDSSEFISGYRPRQTDPQRLLIWYRDPAVTKEKYVLFDDDDDEGFAKQQLTPPVPVLSDLIYNNLQMVGSSQGLFYLSACYRDVDHPLYNVKGATAVLWNPSIRKSVCIPVPCKSRWVDTISGFGVCPITYDPTIVKFTSLRDVETEVSFPLVEVFTLSSGSWRIPSGILPKRSIEATSYQVAIDRFIYWDAYDHDEQIQKNLILLFDMTTEEFRVIDLPDSLASSDTLLVSSKVRDSLAVLDYSELGVCDVWIIDDHAVRHSFTKLFTIDTSYESIMILEFTNSGEPLMEIYREDFKETAALVVYEPSSQHIKDIGIYAESATLFVGSYMETLLLLDQPDCSVLF